MKSYKLEFASGHADRMHIYKLDGAWDWVGLFELKRAMLWLLLDVTQNTNLSFQSEEKFTKFMERQCYPRVISDEEIFNWLGNELSSKI